MPASASALKQIRSSSLGIVSSICRGGRASAVAIRSSSDFPGFGGERSSPGQELVEHHAQAEYVGAPIDPVPLATSLLGTHVGRCSSEPRPLAEVLVSHRKPEIRHTGFSHGIDQDVGGLDVPVDQPSGVGVVQGFGDCGHQFRRFTETGASSLILVARLLPSMYLDTT